jgi:diadenylate cyclase
MMLPFIKAIVEILIISFLYYAAIVFIRGTRAEQVLKGLVVLAICFFVAKLLQLDTLYWIMQRLFGVAVIALIVIFHPELRLALANLGKRKFFTSLSPQEKMVSILVDSTTSLASQKTGAIIAIERSISLGEYIKSGVELNAQPSAEIFTTIFSPASPLHDGGIIVSRDVIRSAASIFPLSSRPSVVKSLGTRHRAAIGLTEESDAIVIVVSEETGQISIAEGGRLTINVGKEDLTQRLRQVYITTRHRRARGREPAAKPHIQQQPAHSTQLASSGNPNGEQQPIQSTDPEN